MAGEAQCQVRGKTFPLGIRSWLSGKDGVSRTLHLRLFLALGWMDGWKDAWMDGKMDGYIASKPS